MRKQRKRNLATVFLIVFVDIIFRLISYSNINLESMGFNLGFTILILVVVYDIMERKFGVTKMKIEDSIFLGGVSLTIRSLMSFIIAYFLDGSMYSIIFIISLSLKSILEGVTYGSFAWWAGKKMVR